MDAKRALSLNQAAKCETAREPVCKCRCGGKLHGAGRGVSYEIDFFASLPNDDPHYIENVEQKRAKREEVQKRKWDAREQIEFRYNVED